MLFSHQLFIENALGRKIIKINPIGSVCDGRLTCYITITGEEKYFIKIYSRENKELYLREKSVLVQFTDSVVPKLIIADDKRRIIITKYIKGRIPQSLEEDTLLDNVIFSFLEFLKVKGTKNNDHGLIVKKYIGLLQEEFSDLNFKIAVKDIISSLNSQPKCGCHGDLQPRNIMLSYGKVYIIDFESLCFDTPLLDAIRFSFSPDLKITYPTRVKILSKFVKSLELKFDFKYSRSIIDYTCIYWAITCAGFYLSNYKKETEEGGKYNYILKYCLNIILKLSKKYE